MNLKDLIAKQQPQAERRSEARSEAPRLGSIVNTNDSSKEASPPTHEVEDSAAAPSETESEKPKFKLGAAPKKLALTTLPKAAAAQPTKQVDVVDSMDLSSLASLDTTSIPEAGPAAQAFPDEIEATAPARELPADLSAQQLNFVESLDVIYTVLHDPDMMGQAIRSVMQELQESPEFIQLVSDHDVHTMIKAIRNVMGIAKIRKEEKSTKRTAGTRTKRTAASKFDADTLDSLNELFAGMPSDD